MPRIQVEDTHPDRVMFPADGITKRDLVDYYCEVADTMLPHLKSRPLNVQRFPRGLRADRFTIRDIPSGSPDNPIRGPTCPRHSPIIDWPRSSAWRSFVPELPDVEGFRRELAGALPGRRIRHVNVRDPGILRNTTARLSAAD